MNKIVSLLFVLILGIMAVGCSNIKKVEKVKITIAAAASLENALEDDLIPVFENEHPNIEIEGVYDSSGKLVIQIEEGLEADLFFSAASAQMNDLNEEGYIDEDSITDLLVNKLVLIKNKNCDTKVTSFENISEAEMIAIGDPEVVPAGSYAKEALTSLKIYDSLLNANKFSLGGNVTEVLSWVEKGSAEVGIVYSSDAISSNEVEIIAECDDTLLQTPVIYPAAKLSKTKHDDEASAFLEFLKSKEALKVFEKYGFSSK